MARLVAIDLYISTFSAFEVRHIAIHIQTVTAYDGTMPSKGKKRSSQTPVQFREVVRRLLGTPPAPKAKAKKKK
jgi:hypothetical protein